MDLEEIRRISLEQAKLILEKIGIGVHHPQYAIKHYELQFSIYHAIKKSLEL